MTRRKRHSSPEIAAKLAQAETLVAQGQRQIDVCRSLGISVMTFHRWRKALKQQQAPSIAYSESGAVDLPPQHRSKRIADLHIENERLRRLVTDLLLEKMRLEEAQANMRLPSPRLVKS